MSQRDYSTICGKFEPAACLPRSDFNALIDLAEYGIILAILIAVPILLVKLRRCLLKQADTATQQDTTKVS